MTINIPTPDLAKYVGAFSLIGVGVYEVVKGQDQTGWALVVAGAAELGVKVVAPTPAATPTAPFVVTPQPPPGA